MKVSYNDSQRVENKKADTIMCRLFVDMTLAYLRDKIQVTNFPIFSSLTIVFAGIGIGPQVPLDPFFTFPA